MGKSSIKKKVKYCGITIQVILYIVNGAAWMIAVFSIGLGLVVGLSSNTIGTDTQALDFLITTPATIFIFYGTVLLIVCVIGCFASVSANFWTTAAYIFLILMFALFDTIPGIKILIGHDSYNEFLASIKKSQDGYGVDEASKTGVIPLTPTVFWEHLQRRGKCCGLYTYEEWRNTTFGTTHYSIPDSCCNEQYDYEGCGELAWKHPDHGTHTLVSIIYEKSCIDVFPKPLREDNRQHINITGKFLAAVLILCLCLAFVLLGLVASKQFRPAEGLNNPTFMETPVEPEIGNRQNRRVHPATDAAGDRRIDHDNNNVPRARKISFDESGPRFIPTRGRTPIQNTRGHN